MARSINRRNMIKASMAAGILGMSSGTETANGDMHITASAGLEAAFANGQYQRPDLPYAYDALEPYYQQRNLEIHHQKHHSGYVNGLNSTMEKLSQARRSGDYGSIKSLSRALAFHGSGHVLHCLFWHSMTPGGSDMPDSLASAMKRSFGSVDNGKKQFAAATKSVEASGWGVLAYEPLSGDLIILQAEKHQDLTIWGVTPLLVCDVWEHAYYLKYANDRGSWVDNFVRIANWAFADARLKEAAGDDQMA